MVFLSILLFLLVSLSAQNSVFFSLNEDSSSNLQKSNLDGSSESEFYALPDINDYIPGIAVDVTNNVVYFTHQSNTGTSYIRKINTNGTGAGTVIAQKAKPIAYGDGKLFYAKNSGDWDLRSCNVDGTGDTQLLLPGNPSTGKIDAVVYDGDNNKLYFADNVSGSGAIKSCDPDGTNVSTVKSVSAQALAYYNGKIYYALSEGTWNLRKCDIDGSNDAFVAALSDAVTGQIFGIAIDTVNEKLYYIEEDNTQSRIAKCNLDGSGLSTFKSYDGFDIEIGQTFGSSASAPTAVSNAAGSVTSSSAILNGTVNDNGAETTITFEYGETVAYGSTVTADQSPLTGGTNTPVSKSITGLDDATEYNFRVKAVNSEGTTYGANNSFTTLPDAATNVFPANNSIDMPRSVTVNWRYSGSGTPTGFKVYQNGSQIGSNILYTTDKLYYKDLDIAAYGSTVIWKVVPYNVAGECSGPVTWTFYIMNDPGTGEAEEPDEVVYNELENVTVTNPPTITMPPINLGQGDIQPTLNFNYDNAPTIPTLSVQVMDQPSNPLPQPQNCAAALSAFFPVNNQTTIVFYFSNTTSPNELVHWNGADWDDVTVTSGADFSTPGQVTFTWTSSSRADEEFAVNGGGDSTLPVELSSFNAVQTSSDFAQLNWVTQSENNNLGFNILRSNYKDVAEAVKVNYDIIAGTNTSAEHTYSFTDEDIEYETEYFYWLESLDFNSNSKYFGPVRITIERDKDDDTPDVQIGAGIHKIYPNPFNPRTTIEYSIYEDGDVMISVYNIKGQLIRTFNEGFKEANKIEEVVWDGKDNNSGNVSSGVYFIRIESGNTVETRKAVLLK